MNRTTFNNEMKISFMENNGVTSVLAAVTLYASESFKDSDWEGTDINRQERLDIAIKCLRDDIAMQMFGDIRGLLFSLQRSMLKSKLGVDKDSVRNPIAKARGLQEQMQAEPDQTQPARATIRANAERQIGTSEMLPQSRTLRLRIKQVYGLSQCL